MDFFRSQLMQRIKLTALINLYSLMKIPLLAFVTPEVKELTTEKCVVKIRLGYRTRNHLNSMYFGALAIGAEFSIGAATVQATQHSGKQIDIIFKNFQADFLKRAGGHVLFVCEQVKDVQALVDKAAKSSERVSETFKGFARTEESEEPIMKYSLTLSVKGRSG